MKYYLDEDLSHLAERLRPAEISATCDHVFPTPTRKLLLLIHCATTYHVPEIILPASRRVFMATPTETIHIEGLPIGTMAALEELARSKGKSAEEYVRTMIEAQLLAQRPFSEIVAPIRKEFKESGMTEDEFDALFKEAREEVYQKKLSKIK